MEDPKNLLDWGLKHEENARKAHHRLEASKHNQFSLIPKGLLISRTKPFLGASPDNITNCMCTPPCASIVIEYKCPWSHKELDPKEAFLQPEIGGMSLNDKFFLKEKSRYFYQIQLLMHVAGLENCDLQVVREFQGSHDCDARENGEDGEHLDRSQRIIASFCSGRQLRTVSLKSNNLKSYSSKLCNFKAVIYYIIAYNVGDCSFLKFLCLDILKFVRRINASLDAQFDQRATVNFHLPESSYKILYPL